MNLTTLDKLTLDAAGISLLVIACIIATYLVKGLNKFLEFLTDTFGEYWAKRICIAPFIAIAIFSWVHIYRHLCIDMH